MSQKSLKIADAHIIFFSGGCRSGKSAAAERWVETKAPVRAYLATAEARDPEMAARIRKHQERRDQGWHTLELPSSESLNLAVWLQKAACRGQAILLDSLTLWVAACMELTDNNTDIIQAFTAALQGMSALPPLAMVSNESGMGITPDSPSGRRFCDLLGEINQLAAAASDHAIFMVSGLPLLLK